MLARKLIFVRINFSYIIIVIILIFLVLGIFPISPIENDGMRISLGVQSNRLYGDRAYSYRYSTQAGTYQLTDIAVRFLGLDSFHALSLITAVSFALFLIASVFFLKRITHSAFVLCFLSLILFQESYVSGYYPNSSIIAAAFLSIALLLCTWREKPTFVFLSGIFFAAACWSRIDAVLIGFAFIILIAEKKPRAIKNLILFGLSSVFTLSVLLLISDISIQLIMEQFFRHRSAAIDIRGTFNVYSTIFTLAAMYFIAYGLYQLLISAEWRLVALTLLAPLPLILAYGRSTVSPKYLLYGLVFFAIPITFGLNKMIRETSRKRAPLIWIGIILVVGQFLLTPPYELLFNRSISVQTADHSRLRGAIAYTPLQWNQQKIYRNAEFSVLQNVVLEYILKFDSPYLVAHDWMANHWLLYTLQTLGYRITDQQAFSKVLEHGQRLILSNGQNNVYLIRWQPDIDLDFPQVLKDEISLVRSVFYIGPTYINEVEATNQYELLSEHFLSANSEKLQNFRIVEFKK